MPNLSSKSLKAPLCPYHSRLSRMLRNQQIDSSVFRTDRVLSTWVQMSPKRTPRSLQVCRLCKISPASLNHEITALRNLCLRNAPYLTFCRRDASKKLSRRAKASNLFGLKMQKHSEWTKFMCACPATSASPNYVTWRIISAHTFKNDRLSANYVARLSASREIKTGTKGKRFAKKIIKSLSRPLSDTCCLSAQIFPEPSLLIYFESQTFNWINKFY